MAKAGIRSGHFAWGVCGVGALVAHGLLLLCLPCAPRATAAAAVATEVSWEIESWEAPEPAAEAEQPGGLRSQASPPLRPAPARVRARRSHPALAAPEAKSKAIAPNPTSEPPANAHTTGSHDTSAGTFVGDHGSRASAGGKGQGATAGAGSGTLMRGPRLLATRDPCAGFFPGTADAKRGQVQLSVDVDADGRPHPTQILLELPRGQGFQSAAKACAAHLRFAPALDAQGRPVSASARIALRFERS